MPRLVLSMPAELGTGPDAPTDKSGKSDSRTAPETVETADADEKSNDDDRPQIEAWLSCWVE